MSEDNNNYICCPSHCCDQHGCKYGMDGCPVANGTCQQEGPCQTCGETESGFYGDANEFGYYDSAMVWHSPIGSQDHEREVEDRLLGRVAAFLRGRGLHDAARDVEAREFE
jgi:hypothetical protein